MPRTFRTCALVIVPGLLVAARLAAEGFVCAGHALPPPVLAEIAAKPAQARDNPVSPQGRVHALVIFAQFKDEAPDDLTVPTYAADLFDPDLAGSLTHFYHTMSFGQLAVEGTVLPKRYTSDHPATAYLSSEPDEPGGYGQFAQEILRQADQDVDFAQFDNDGPDGIPNSGDDDGVVDYVFLCVRSTPYGFVLRGATATAGLGFAEYVSPDTVAAGASMRIKGFWSWGAVGRAGPLAQTVGVLAHEFGHSLGLPDLFDREYEDPESDSAGVGRWGLMGWGADGWNGHDGPNPFCAWSLEQLGWIREDNGRLLQVVAETAELVLADLHAGGTAVRIPFRLGSVDGHSFEQEHLLLEYRTRSGTFYNRNLPAEGLLVWHIRPQVKSKRRGVNNDEYHKRVDLVCADGLYRDAGYPLGHVADPAQGSDNLDFWAHDAAYREAHSGNMGDATDPFDGVRFTRFDAQTNPASEPPGLLPSATTGLTLSLRREEEAMVVDVLPPRWAGVIVGEVHWAGTVLVDGDLRVAPEGSLTIHGPARVLFAGNDRRHGGRDPDRCELEIQGNLRIAGQEVVFAAQHPDELWYGLVLDPAETSRLLVPEDSFVLRDAVHGVVAPGARVQVFLGDHYSVAEQNTLRRMLEESLAELGLNARFLPITSSGRYFYHPLLEALEGDGDLVIWLGNQNTMTARALALLRSFLERGGRLLLVSHTFGSYPDIDRSEFLAEMLHVTSLERRSGWAQLHTLYLSEPLRFRREHRRLELTLPAEPVLLDDDHRGAGLRLDTVTYRAVYLPFDLDGLAADVVRGLIGSSLQFLLSQQFVEEAVLDMDVGDQVGPVLGIPPDRPTVVQARVTGAVDAVDLVVSSIPEREMLAFHPMQPVAESGATKLFGTAFQPPAPGQYHLSLRVSSAAGDTLFVWPGQRVIGLFPDRPAVLFLGEQHPGAPNGFAPELRALFEEELRQEGLAANAVRVANEEGAFYENLLGRYLEETELVVWLGQTLDERCQATFRAFLERGGRLLLISREFHTSPGAGTFLQEMLHARPRSTPGRSEYRSTLHLREPVELMLWPGCVLELIAPAVPLLVGEGTQVAGMAVDNGRHRVVYLPFGLFAVDEVWRRSLTESSLAFLVQGGSQEPHLQLGPVIAPPVLMGLRPLAPHLTVGNWGAKDSEAFRVGYQILLGEEVLAAGAREETALAALAEREIVLPVWEPGAEGAFHIRFGLGVPVQADLVYGPARWLYVAELGEAFSEVALPGQVSEGHGAGSFDYDNDGDLDLYLVRRSEANQLLRNEGADFTEVAAAAGVADAVKGRGLAVGDYDGDGDLDLYLVNDGANRFLRNNGDATFVDVTAALDADPATTAPLGDAGRGRSAAFVDHDLDGDLDLYLVNSSQSVNRFYRNDEGGFAEDAAAAGLDHGGAGRGLAIGDYDGDGDVDLFVANSTGGSRLCRNDGGTFAEVQEEMELEFAGGAYAGVFGDLDNDGDADLFVSNSKGPNQLFRNDGGVSFQEVTPGDVLSLGQQSRGAAFFDHDNDGDLDLVTTASSLASGGDELYQNVRGHLAPVGHLLGLQPKSRGFGVSFGDYDQDGHVEWFVAGGEHSRLYRNQTSQNHWLQVDLAGIEPNLDGLGARVELSGNGARQYREVQSAYGYCSQVQPWVHFGLGDAAEVDTLRVQWPDGQETVETDVAADQHLVVKHPSLITAVLDGQAEQPTTFELWPNYPNPFNAQTIISYQIPHGALVQLTVYNVAGQPVKRLVQEVHEAGAYRVSWDGADNEGRVAGSGVYFCRLQAGDYRQARRLVLLK